MRLISTFLLTFSNGYRFFKLEYGGIMKGLFARLVVTMLLSVSSALYAETIQVTSDQDPSTPTPGTLRYVIQKASCNDTIQFASEVTSITLTQGDIHIDVDLTIQGPGVTLSGNNNSRIFKIHKGKQLYLEALVLTNGSVNDSEGGGALLNYGFLMLSNCILTGNRSETGDGMGGAIYSIGGELIVDNCIFTENNAAFTSGAIFAYAGEVFINDCFFIGNQAQSDGGAIENRGNKMSITNTLFSNNSAVSADGGAILNNFGTLTVSDSTFIKNSSGADGGAIWNNNNSSLQVKKSTFTENSAAGSHGGAILNNRDGEFTITNSTAILNTPDNIYNQNN